MRMWVAITELVGAVAAEMNVVELTMQKYRNGLVWRLAQPGLK